MTPLTAQDARVWLYDNVDVFEANEKGLFSSVDFQSDSGLVFSHGSRPSMLAGRSAVYDVNGPSAGGRTGVADLVLEEP
jgi:hypothetical protein